MGDLSKLNSMTREQLLAFAHYAYTAYPTLLEAHEIRESFREQYPTQSSYMGPAIPIIEDEDVDRGEFPSASTVDGTREPRE